MVAEVPAAKDLFAKASEILGYDLLKLCVEGEGPLTLTRVIYCNKSIIYQYV